MIEITPEIMRPGIEEEYADALAESATVAARRVNGGRPTIRQTGASCWRWRADLDAAGLCKPRSAMPNGARVRRLSFCGRVLVFRSDRSPYKPPCASSNTDPGGLSVV